MTAALIHAKGRAGGYDETALAALAAAVRDATTPTTPAGLTGPQSFALDQALAIIDDATERLGAVARGLGRRGHTMTRFGGSKLAMGRQGASIAAIAARLGWGTSSMRLGLAEAVRRGLITRHGKTKGTYYVLSAAT